MKGHRCSQGQSQRSLLQPVKSKDRKGNPVAFTQDEGIRDTSMEALARLPGVS
jgi:hypothetical protein